MDLHLRDKVVLVSGGAKGIGKSICLQLIEEQAIQVLLDKDSQAGQQFERQNSSSVFIEVDLTSAPACKTAIEKVSQKFGRVDAIVNNAGFNDGVGLEKGTVEKFMASVNNNAMHFYARVHHCLPLLKASHGSIVNIASKVAVTGQGNTSGYAAAKGAILSLTREWSVELLQYGIRVNAILPAEVWTPLYESWINSTPDPAARKKEIENKIPLGKRLTTPEEIANMVVFLLSDRCSHVTGQWIHVDGGYTHLDRAIQ
jgi:NAD(P)-dependent dehydrogenase (short-subunit alcohol dehydrogenase family)